VTNISQSNSASADALLIRALGRGDEAALRSLIDRYMPEIYGLLRMTLASGREVEAALCDTFCAAAERAGDPLARVDPGKWLAGIALEQVELRAQPSPPVSLEKRRQARGRSAPTEGADEDVLDDPAYLDGISDSALAVLIRTLEPRTRQAVALSTVYGLEDARIASAIGCETWEVAKLKAAGISKLLEMIDLHRRREEKLKSQIAAVPYELRPIPVGNAGRGPAEGTVVVGTKVHLEPAQPKGIVQLVRAALKRMAELFRRHRDETDLSDDVGEGGPQKTPDPTPTLRPFEKPGSTPTTRGYRNPKLSPGVAVYTMPRGTPTTRRLSNPRRPSS
jgi:DNA-directed RNA polymerase specialized sigma24 family protein